MSVICPCLPVVLVDADLCGHETLSHGHSALSYPKALYGISASTPKDPVRAWHLHVFMCELHGAVMLAAHTQFSIRIVVISFADKHHGFFRNTCCMTGPISTVTSWGNML